MSGAKRVSKGVYKYRGFQLTLSPDGPVSERWTATAPGFDGVLSYSQKSLLMEAVDQYVERFRSGDPVDDDVVQTSAPRRVTSRTASNRTKNGSLGRGRAPWPF
jgi:hypothetical protein